MICPGVSMCFVFSHLPKLKVFLKSFVLNMCWTSLAETNFYLNKNDQIRSCLVFDDKLFAYFVMSGGKGGAVMRPVLLGSLIPFCSTTSGKSM